MSRADCTHTVIYTGAEMKAETSKQEHVIPCELSTDEFAKLNHVKPNTVRQRLCNTGSFYGVKPQKLATRRTLWPAIRATLDA